jgi:hypothetical protein
VADAAVTLGLTVAAVTRWLMEVAPLVLGVVVETALEALQHWLQVPPKKKKIQYIKAS